jgi:phospholipase/carboxylesterase
MVTKPERTFMQSVEDGRLTSRPRLVRDNAQVGIRRLELERRRDGLIYIPKGYSAASPTPLAVMLHGAGGDAEHGLSLLREFADESNLILVAPESRSNTWDVMVHDYGPDVAFIDRALEKTFLQYSVDPDRLAIGGFSDGASYALSLGPMNGKFFTHIIAFSPGFMLPKRQEGTPRVFISHGKRDTVLPIDRCSRSIVPRLEREGYDFVYHEFNGPHVVPHEIAREAVDWFVRM